MINAKVYRIFLGKSDVANSVRREGTRYNRCQVDNYCPKRPLFIWRQDVY